MRFAGKIQAALVKIHLHKVIPTGAGLGGGSSNAAFMIKLLNDIFSLKMNNPSNAGNSSDFLAAIALSLLKIIPVLATNKGDVFENINLDLSKYYIVACQTRSAYFNTRSIFTCRAPQCTLSLKNIDVSKISEWKDYIGNDFEKLFLINP